MAGRGAAAKLLPLARARLAEIGIRDVLVTRAEGEEEILAAHAIARGVRSFVILGGDGTCSKVTNAILKSGVDCLVGVLPCGTGNDFAKTLGVEGTTPEGVAALVTRGSVGRIDVGLADGNYFLNSCGFGFDASVLEASQRVRFLKGDALYIYSALAQLFSYRGIAISADGALKIRSDRMLMAIASNGRSLGGAFRIAPTASATDGKLDFCVFGDSNVWGRVRLFAGALRGGHLTLPGVTSINGNSLSLTFADNPAMEMDGELRQATSRTVRIECVPRALAVFAAPGALV